MNPRKKVNKDKIKIHYWENECSPLGRQIATSTTTLHCLHYPLNSGRDPSRYEIEIIKDAWDWSPCKKALQCPRVINALWLAAPLPSTSAVHSHLQKPIQIRCGIVTRTELIVSAKWCRHSCTSDIHRPQIRRLSFLRIYLSWSNVICTHKYGPDEHFITSSFSEVFFVKNASSRFEPK